jgi:RNA polymerase sigma factor (sigma-70 family)
MAIARERWHQIMDDQPEHYRRIIQLRLEGYTYQDIADTLQLAESTVRRFLKRLFDERVI